MKMLVKLIILAAMAVTGVYGSIEVLFLDVFSIGMRILFFAALVLIGYLGIKGFEKNWNLYCRDDYEIIHAKKQRRRERMASMVFAAIFM